MVGSVAIIALLNLSPVGADSADGIETLPVATQPSWAGSLVSLEPPQAPPESVGLVVYPPAPDVFRAASGNSATHVSILGFTETEAVNYRPLTGHERWELFLNSTFTTPGAYAPVLVTAAVSQLQRTPPEWGQGASGFNKRLAVAFGTNIVQGVIQTAGDALTKEDPRFVRAGTGGFWHRAQHAVLFTVFTLDDRGRTRFGAANLASFYGSSVVSALWYPRGHNALREGVRAANLQIAMNAVFNLFQEFWPDIKRAIRH
jgi:hypothetical protein